MTTANLGQVLALVGFCLLILSRIGLRRSPRQRQAGTTTSLRWQRWGDITACGLIVAGLLFMGVSR
ncbi:MAG: hypothetical protein Q8M54_12375 [Desulfobaccales bacterium]|nr:hypothetical protein [Desulfobaccales bacterium]